MDKFQVYLQKNPQFFEQITNFGGKRERRQDEKKSLHLNKVQMLVLRSNFILLEKIGAQIYFDNSGRNSADYFLKNI